MMGLLTLVLVLTPVASAFAQPARTHWKCDEFLVVDIGNTAWRQTDTNTGGTLDWKEVCRTNTYIELQHPGNKDIYGRLYNTTFYIKRPGAGWNLEKHGRWTQ